MQRLFPLGTPRTKIALVVGIFIVSFLSVARLHAQGVGESHSVGVPRYVQPEAAPFRIIFGYGGNAGVGGLTPSSFIGNASYQSGISELTAGFVASDNNITTVLPRRNYDEFDLMYGISFDAVLPHYQGPSDGMHTTLSAGVSFDAYQENWRPYGRRGEPLFPYPPPAFEYSVGFPIQFQAIYEPIRLWGIGAGIGALLFYNISAFSPSYGGALVVEASF